MKQLIYILCIQQRKITKKNHTHIQTPPFMATYLQEILQIYIVWNNVFKYRGIHNVYRYDT